MAAGEMAREQIVEALRRSGMEQLATLAAETLPEQVGPQELDSFCARVGMSRGELMDRMGGSP